MTNIAELKGVTKIYGKGATEVVVLDNVSLSIEKGAAVSVMGPSGSGKTTLLNMLGALDKPTSGQVFISGEEISKVPERKLYKVRREKVGFVFQTYYLVPTLSALENVLLPTLPIGRDRYQEKAIEILDQVGLAKRAHHRPSELSGGEQQRVVIARALINSPQIILADEPTGNLDSKTGGEIIDLLLVLNKKEGATLVIVTHEESIAQRADRLLKLLDGRIV